MKYSQSEREQMIKSGAELAAAVAVAIAGESRPEDRSAIVVRAFEHGIEAARKVIDN